MTLREALSRSIAPEYGHTPTPWTITKAHKPDNAGGWDWAILDPDRKVIAEVFDVVGEDRYGVQRRPSEVNAALIVKAVNNHQALIDALKLATDIAESFIRSELEGTSSFKSAMSRLEPCRELLGRVGV